MVSLITTADCGLSDTLAHPLSGPIHLTEARSLPISVYPNPANKHLIVEGHKTHIEAGELSLQDASGRSMDLPLIARQGQSFVFDVSHLAPGNTY